MKGAKAEPSVSTIRVPKRSRKIIMGAIHHFLRVRKKSHNSFSIAIFAMALFYHTMSDYESGIIFREEFKTFFVVMNKINKIGRVAVK